VVKSERRMLKCPVHDNGHHIEHQLSRVMLLLDTLVDNVDSTDFCCCTGTVEYLISQQ